MARDGIDYENIQHLLIKARYLAAGIEDTNLLCELIHIALTEASHVEGPCPPLKVRRSGRRIGALDT